MVTDLAKDLDAFEPEGDDVDAPAPLVEGAVSDPDTPKVEDASGNAPEDMVEDVTEDGAKVEGEPEVSDAVVVEETPADEGDKADEPEDDMVETAKDLPEVDTPREGNTSKLPPLAPPAPHEPRKSGFWGLLLGGVAAAVFGFVLANVVPDGWPVGMSDELSAQINAQSEDISALEADLEGAKSAALEAAAVSEQADSDALSRIAAMETQISEIIIRLDEEPPIVITDDAEIPADLAALLLAQKAEMEKLQADLLEMAQIAQTQTQTSQEAAEAAAAAEARAKARDAMNTVRLALASGDAFSDVIETIAGAVEVPAGLEAAASGVATQAALEDSFGPAARAALASANRELAGDGAADRAKLLFQDLLGARSLAPRDGDSPDAVLSRVEGSLRNGDLAGAIETAQALPQAGQDALSDWLAMAGARDAALQAFSDISDALSAN